MYGPKEEVPFIEFVDADDIWVRFYTIPKAGYAVPQHAHEHDRSEEHTSELQSH